MGSTPTPLPPQRDPSRVGEPLLVRVRVGFEPRVIVVSAGEPLLLELRRETASVCAERFVFPAFGVAQSLPLGRPVRIELPSVPAGEYLVRVRLRHEAREADRPVKAPPGAQTLVGLNPCGAGGCRLLSMGHVRQNVSFGQASRCE